MIRKILSESFFLAIQQLRVNKLRSTLSLVGITIGIFSIVAIASAVDSMKEDVTTSLQKFGDELITIEKWPSFTSTDYPWWKYVNRPETNFKEFEYLKKALNSADVVSFAALCPDPNVTYNSKKVSGLDVLASSYEIGEALNLEVQLGRYFTPQESHGGLPVAVVGAGIVEEVMKDHPDPVGQTISILNREVKIVGVLRKQGKDMLGFDFDKKIYIPFEYATKQTYMNPNETFPQIIIKPKSLSKVDPLVAEIEGQMRKIRHLRPTDDNNFAINKLSMASETIKGVFSYLELLKWLLGGFAILVGGFGIANIMYVSVSERTNIIGIKKAIGSTKGFILAEFLTESVILCCLGGILGILLVMLMAFLVSDAMGMKFFVGINNAILGVVVSTIIGVVFGFFPALRAANLDPVEAIRSN